MKKTGMLLWSLLLGAPAFAADTGAVVGGAAGAAAGTIIGKKVGGDKGAVVGAAIGAATGVALGGKDSGAAQAAPARTSNMAEDEDGHERHDRGRHLGERKHKKHERGASEERRSDHDD